MVTGQREGNSGRGGMDQGSHLASLGSFLAKNVGSGVRRTAPDGKKVTLSPPRCKAVSSEMRPAEPRDKRKAVFFSSTFSSLQSTRIEAAASNNFARDQEIGLGGGLGRWAAHDFTMLMNGSSFHLIPKP